MLVKIENINHNPLRDFSLYPINKEQVAKLAKSIEKDSFWAGLPAREVDGEYEILAGHHRLEAAKAAGLEEIELNVGEYTDEDMASIMVAENLTQRGATTFGATIEAVAAVCRNLAKDIMGQTPGDEPEDKDGDTHKTWAAHAKSISTSQGQIKSGRGVGREAVAKHLEGQVSEYTVGQAIKVLKETGMYAKILKGIVTAKQLKDKYNAKDPKMGKAYTAIASWSTPALGVAFMSAAKECPGLTQAQYLALANNIRLEADKAGKVVTAGLIKEKVEAKTGKEDDAPAQTPREKQIEDEIKIREMAEKFAERLSIFVANYPQETSKLVNDPGEWIEKVKNSLTPIAATDVETEKETKAADEADLNDIEAEEAGIEEAEQEVEL